MFKEWVGRLGFFFFVCVFKEWIRKFFFRCEIQGWQCIDHPGKHEWENPDWAILSKMEVLGNTG